VFVPERFADGPRLECHKASRTRIRRNKYLRSKSLGEWTLESENTGRETKTATMPESGLAYIKSKNQKNDYKAI